MSDFPAAPPPSMGMAGTPATFVQRLVAVLIDIGIMLAMYIPVFIVLFIVGQISSVLGLLLGFVLYLVLLVAAAWLYIGNIGKTGQTPGKRMQGIQVVNDAGQAVGLGGAAIRWIVSGLSNTILCLLPIGSLWMLWDGEKKTLYDKILNNKVVQVPTGELMPIFVDGNPI